MKIKVRHFRVLQVDGLKKKGKPDVVSLYRRGVGFLGERFKGFKPHERGGFTHYSIKLQNGDTFVGTATCSMSDQFSYKEGYQIAKKRAEEELFEYADNILYEKEEEDG